MHSYTEQAAEQTLQFFAVCRVTRRASNIPFVPSINSWNVTTTFPSSFSSPSRLISVTSWETAPHITQCTQQYHLAVLPSFPCLPGVWLIAGPSLLTASNQKLEAGEGLRMRLVVNSPWYTLFLIGLRASIGATRSYSSHLFLCTLDRWLSESYLALCWTRAHKNGRLEEECVTT